MKVGNFFIFPLAARNVPTDSRKFSLPSRECVWHDRYARLSKNFPPFLLVAWLVEQEYFPSSSSPVRQATNVPQPESKEEFANV